MKRSMCPNEACPRYGQETRLLGGCDCGTLLVRYRTEPTNEQLARLVSMFSMSTVAEEEGIGPISVEMAQQWLDADPSLRAAWLVRHREVQAAIGGAA